MSAALQTPAPTRPPTEMTPPSGGHVLPVALYLKVFGALLFLTGVTVFVSYLDLGRTSIVVAMSVAVVKAFLVAAYFMHLKFDEPFHVLIFVASILFVVLFFALTLVEFGSRGDVVPEQDTPAYEQDNPPAAPVPTPTPLGNTPAAPPVGQQQPSAAGQCDWRAFTASLCERRMV